MKFWIYLERELSDLQSEFEEIFGVNNLYRDYENVWEWLESEDDTAKFNLKISRSHNWKTGDYDKPILILVHSESEPVLNESQIAMRIKDRFNCDVFAGEITFESYDKIIIGDHRKY